MQGADMMLRFFLIAVPAIVVWGSMAVAQPSAPRSQESQTKSEIHILPVQGNVYMLFGAGGNIALQTGKDGLLLVDTGLAARSGETLAAIRTLSKDPIRFILNTHVHADHAGANAA